MNRGYSFAVWAAVILLTMGCASQPQPDLDRVYHRLGNQPKSHPLIVIPGMMGSRLVARDSGENVWPGGIWNLIFGSKLDRLRLPVHSPPPHTARGPLKPGDLFFDAYGQDFYGTILSTLEGPGGYRCVSSRKLKAKSNCVLFSWDWRRDLTRAAARLDQLIERWRKLRKEPGMEVDIVAHSAGGLVTRYFVRYGGKDVLDSPRSNITLEGAAKVNQAVLIGTPNFGSVYGLQRAIKGKQVGLTELRPETMATMPGLYQMLPHPDRSWMIDIHGNRVERDLYALKTWKRYRWSIFDPEVRTRIRRRFREPERADEYLRNLGRFARESLTRARRFHRALSKPSFAVPTRYVVFGSACILTPSRCLIERVDGETRVRLFPDQVVNRKKGVDYERLMLDPGDGAVTRASLLATDRLPGGTTKKGDFPIDFTVFVCERHETLPSNITFRDNLLNMLLYPR